MIFTEITFQRTRHWPSTKTSTYGTDIEIRGAYSTDTDDLLFVGDQREDPRTSSSEDFTPALSKSAMLLVIQLGIGEDFTSNNAQKHKFMRSIILQDDHCKPRGFYLHQR